MAHGRFSRQTVLAEPGKMRLQAPLGNLGPWRIWVRSFGGIPVRYAIGQLAGPFLPAFPQFSAAGALYRQGQGALASASVLE